MFLQQIKVMSGFLRQLQNLKVFFSIDHMKRTTKHISDPAKRSACKRINMFLRWMVRKDTSGVDVFGIWNKISTSILSCPLDTLPLELLKI